MPKVLCVDPILNSKNLFSLTLFGEGKVEFQKIQEYDREDYGSEVTRICYDLQRLDVRGFVYDVKVLHELHGTKVEGLIDLTQKIIGEYKTERYNYLSRRLRSHLNSYSAAKVNTEKYEPTQLFPENLLEETYLERAQLIYELFNRAQTEEVMEFYGWFRKVMYTIYNVSKESIRINVRALDDFQNHTAESIKKNLKEGRIQLTFNPVGAKTGRLTCKKNTVNIFTVPKEMRHVIVADEDYSIVQYDYKSFQPRIAIFSTLDQNFKDRFAEVEDIYSVFPGDREKNKISFLQWMFSPDHPSIFQEVAQPLMDFRDNLYEQARQNGKIINQFNRPLFYHNEEKHQLFQNFVTSNEADAMFRVLAAIELLLMGRKSKIMFPFHDAIVVKVHKDEADYVETIRDIMERYFLNQIFHVRLPVNVKKGQNFGEMTDVPATG